VAVHGLVYLLHVGRAASSRELADNICTNPARVRKIMGELHRAGLLSSREGRGKGGYRALPESGEITLEQVLDAVGEPAVPAAWRTGDMDRECLISSGMGKMMDGLCRELDGLCRARLAQITVGAVCAQLFEEKPDSAADDS